MYTIRLEHGIEKPVVTKGNSKKYATGFVKKEHLGKEEYYKMVSDVHFHTEIDGLKKQVDDVLKERGPTGFKTQMNVYDAIEVYTFDDDADKLKEAYDLLTELINANSLKIKGILSVSFKEMKRTETLDEATLYPEYVTIGCSGRTFEEFMQKHVNYSQLS